MPPTCCVQDMDFFGELTPEEQKAADEKKRVIEEAKARGAAKAKLTKSMIIMDVKPWDDTTGAHSAPALQHRSSVPVVLIMILDLHGSMSATSADIDAVQPFKNCQDICP